MSIEMILTIIGSILAIAAAIITPIVKFNTAMIELRVKSENTQKALDKIEKKLDDIAEGIANCDKRIYVLEHNKNYVRA
jgi:hypothetical protein